MNGLNQSQLVPAQLKSLRNSKMRQQNTVMKSTNDDNNESEYVGRSGKIKMGSDDDVDAADEMIDESQEAQILDEYERKMEDLRQ